MDTEWFRATREIASRSLGALDLLRHSFQSTQGHVDRRGHGRRKVGGNAAGGQKFPDGIERLGGAFHRVVSHRAVDVDIEISRHQCRVGKVEMLCAVRYRQSATRLNAGDVTIFNGDLRRLDFCQRSQQLRCCQYCGHTCYLSYESSAGRQTCERIESTTSSIRY